MNYQIKLFDQNGNALTELQEYIQFEVTRKKNDIGTFSIVLPGQFYSVGDFKKDYRAEVWRNGELVGGTCWFLQRIEKGFTGDTQETEFILTFADTIELLSRRVNANFSCESAQCPGHLQGQGDDIIKVLAKFNFGDLVDTDTSTAPDTPWNITGPGIIPPAVTNAYSILEDGVYSRQLPIEIGTYNAEATVINVVNSFRNLLEAYQEIANTVYVTEDENNDIPFYNNLWFDIEYIPRTNTSPEKFELKTWVGIRNRDLRNLVFIGPEYNNLANARYIDDWSSRADIAYVLSDGDHELQIIGGTALPSKINSYYYSLPFGPVEIVTDFQTNSLAPTSQELIDAGLEVLGESILTKTINGTLITTKDFDFITHFNYGDILTLTWDDVAEFVEINEFTISVSGNEETINIPLNLIEEL